MNSHSKRRVGPQRASAPWRHDTVRVQQHRRRQTDEAVPGDRACLHHLLHLDLVGITPAGHGRLDLVRGVLHDLATRRHRLDHGNAAGLADRHRGAHIDLEQHALNSHSGDRELGKERAHFGLEFGETMVDLVGGRGAYDPEGHCPRWTTFGHVEHAIPASGQARVDTHYEHAYESNRSGPAIDAPGKCENPGSMPGFSQLP